MTDYEAETRNTRRVPRDAFERALMERAVRAELARS